MIVKILLLSCMIIAAHGYIFVSNTTGLYILNYTGAPLMAGTGIHKEADETIPNKGREDKPDTNGKTVSLRYRFQEGDLLSYSLSSTVKTEEMDWDFEGEWVQLVSQKEDADTFYLQEMVALGTTSEVEKIENLSQVVRGGVILSARKVEPDGSSCWDHQSFPWLAFGHFVTPVITFPDHPLRVGERWNLVWGELNFILILTLAGFQDVLGYHCAEIKVTVPQEGGVTLEGTLFFALEEGFWVKWVLESQEEGMIYDLNAQLAKLEQLTPEKLEVEQAAWSKMVAGEEYLRSKKSQQAKEKLADLLISHPESLWQRGARNLIGLTERPVQTGRIFPVAWLPVTGVRRVTFSPDGEMLATCFDYGDVLLFYTDLSVREALDRGVISDDLRQKFQSNGISLAPNAAVRIQVEGNVWVIASMDMEKYTVIKEENKLKFSETSSSVLGLWNIRCQKEVDIIQGGVTSAAAFSPDGKLIASGLDKTISLWNIEKRMKMASLKGHASTVTSVAFSPDGKILASASKDGIVKLWDVSAQNETASLSGHKDEVTTIAFHPDGKLLASGSEDGMIKLWNIEKQEEASLQVYAEDMTYKAIPEKEQQSEDLVPVLWLSFSPDGQLLAAAASAGYQIPDDIIRIWRVRGWEEIINLKHGEVNSFAFSPDSKVLGSCGDDWTMILWDTESQTPVAFQSGGQGEYISTMAFSPDGKLLASGSEHGLKLWALYPSMGVFAQTESGK